MNLRKPGAGGLVYSTERGRMCPQCRLPMAKCSCAAQAWAAPRGDGAVRVSRESKGRGGKTVTLVRGLPPHTPRHRSRLLAHLLALGDDDRRLSFGQVATDEQIRLHANHIDFDRDEVFSIFDARLRLVAMAHLAFAADHHSAEFGVSVLAHERGCGFGKRLFEHAVVHARNRGARSMAIHLARDNAPMLTIVRQSGAAVRFEGSDVVADLPLPEDTLGSQLGALMETQAAEWDYRMKLQVLRLDRFWHGLLPAQEPRT